MKISGNASEVANDAAVIRSRAGAVDQKAAEKAVEQKKPEPKTADLVRDEVRFSRLSSDIKNSVDLEAFKAEREKRKEAIRARVAAGDYYVGTDELKVKFLEGLSEHNSFFTAGDLLGVNGDE